MASHSLASIGTAKSQLHDGISTYLCAQRIITVAAAASPSANAHAAMAAYDKACENLRVDILRATKLFPDTDALLTWILDDVADDALGSRIASAWPLLSE